MLRSLYVMLDYHIVATDGEVGRVQDFLFDDESWMVHYLVVETGTWGGGPERVLVVPFELGFSEWESKTLSVLLTRDDLRASPPVESDMPISVQYESGLKQPGSHLRSMREIFGYRIHTSSGEIGSIEDFIVDDALWNVHNVVVAVSGEPVRSILMSPEAIRSISWHGKSAWVNLPLEEVMASPAFDPATPVNQDAGCRLYDYYGRPAESGPAPESR